MNKKRPQNEAELMTTKFKIGDHVGWNSEAGHVRGRIIKIHTRDTEYKGHPRHCSADDPQYEIKSDKTDHVAMHSAARDLIGCAGGRCILVLDDREHAR